MYRRKALKALKGLKGVKAGTGSLAVGLHEPCQEVATVLPL